jgi:hypothetical protein
MPTGYTQIINDKEDVTFRDYALRCARGFGACLLQREEGMDEPPRPREVDPYYARNLAQDRAKLAELESMTVEQAEIIAAAEYEAAVKRHEKDKQEELALRERYARIRAEVERWKPPTPKHNELKKFMLDQLRIGHVEYDVDQWAPKRLSGKKWLAERRKSARNSVSYSEEELLKEEELSRESAEWLSQLVESLEARND